MRAGTIGVVEATGENAPSEYAVGTYVSGSGGVAEYYLGIPGALLYLLHPLHSFTTDFSCRREPLLPRH